MVKIDTTMWNNELRMRERIINLATMIASLSAMNMLYSASKSNWLIFGINCLFFIATLPIFMSHTKWQKEVPINK